MIILRLLLLLTNLHLKLLSTQGTGADKLLSTQRVQFRRNFFQLTVFVFKYRYQIPYAKLNFDYRRKAITKLRALIYKSAF